jgi:hypothetical protein
MVMEKSVYQKRKVKTQKKMAITSLAELITKIKENKVEDVSDGNEVYYAYMLGFIRRNAYDEKVEAVKARVGEFDDMKISHPTLYSHVEKMFDMAMVYGGRMAFMDLVKAGCPKPILTRVEDVFRDIFPIDELKKRALQGKHDPSSSEEEDEEEEDKEEEDEGSSSEDGAKRRRMALEDEERESFLRYISGDEITEDQVVRFWNKWLETMRRVKEREQKSRELSVNFKAGDRVKVKTDDPKWIRYGILVDNDMNAERGVRYAIRDVKVVGGKPQWNRVDTGSRGYGYYTELELVSVD